MNMRAAFLHNVTDAMASVGVIVAGTLIMLKGWVIVDTIMTLVIAGYVLYHGIKAMPDVIHLLMNGVPHNVNIPDLTKQMESRPGVRDVHHVHVWHIDEQRLAMEAHVQIGKDEDMSKVKQDLKDMMRDEFDIHHSTLEFEFPDEDCISC
jgi:cobalt-zinc-cadmium efflux system protein